MVAKKKASALTVKRIRAMHREYFHGLGRFVDRFSQTEQDMAWIMFMLCGVSFDDAQALFSGVRMDEAMNNIRKLAEIRQIADAPKELLSEAFTQLRQISELRNSLLHYGASFDASSKERTTSNRLRSRNIKSFTVSADGFLRLYHDLEKVEAHVSAALSGVIPSRTWGDPHGELLRRAWLYRFRQPKSKGKQNPNNQARQHPP
jgi:hypothetical protein